MLLRCGSVIGSKSKNELDFVIQLKFYFHQPTPVEIKDVLSRGRPAQISISSSRYKQNSENISLSKSLEKQVGERVEVYNAAKRCHSYLFVNLSSVDLC